MNNLNSVLIEGNLTRDPEIRTVSSVRGFLTVGNGTALCNFSIAVNRSYKKGDGFEKEVCYFDIEAWGKLADSVSNYGTKGRSVRVIGRLKQERWQTNEGKSASKVVIVAEYIEFGANKQEPAASEEPADAGYRREPNW